MMNGLLQRVPGLRLRITLVFVIAALVFAGIVGTLAFRTGYEDTLHDGRSRLEGLVAAVEKTAAIGAFANDPVLLQEVIDGLARDPLAGSVEVLGPAGAVLFRRSAKSGIATDSMTVERSLVSPFSATEMVGRLRIVADTSQLEGDARRKATALALSMATQSVLLALILYITATRMVSNPIARLARALHGMRPGTDERLAVPPLHDHDEIGELMTGANALLSETQSALDRERELRAVVEGMEAQYRQIFDASSAGIFVLNADGRLINGNPTVLRVIGSDVKQIQQLRGEDFIHRVFAQPERARAMVVESEQRGETVSGDLELITSDGATRWVHCMISVQGADDASATAARFVEGVMYDVTDRKRTELAVRHAADHDPLTGLKSRASMNAAIDRLIASARTDAGSVTLLCIDLDGFKAVNDRLGHAAGDQVLAECARRMQDAVRRTSDLVGRAGGDEFIITMPGARPNDLATAVLAREVVRRLCQPIQLPDGRTAQIGASIGMACFPHHGQSREEIAEAADQALYEVKRHGKNAVAMSSRPAADREQSASRRPSARPVEGGAASRDEPLEADSGIVGN